VALLFAVLWFKLTSAASDRTSVIGVAFVMASPQDKKKELLKVTFEPRKKPSSPPIDSLKFEEPDGQQIGSSMPGTRQHVPALSGARTDTLQSRSLILAQRLSHSQIRLTTSNYRNEWHKSLDFRKQSRLRVFFDVNNNLESTLFFRRQS
jgi:hypothetical protein